MKKTLMLIMVLGLAVTAKAGIQYSGNDSPVAENVLVTDASVIVIDIRANEGLIVVSGEPAVGNGQCVASPAVMRTATNQMLPEPMILALLGLAGLLYRRQADTRPTTGVSLIKAG